MIPINFFRDELFLDKLVVTSVMEEYFCKKKTITSFTSNREVILNFSPPINSEKKLIEKKIDDFEEIIRNGLDSLIIKFIKKNII